MKISKREMIIGVFALTALLIWITYVMGNTKIDEQRQLSEKKEDLLRQMKLHQRILNEQTNWISRLEELQAELPVYDVKTSVSTKLPPQIRRMADKHGVRLLSSKPRPEKPVGSLFELSINCSWEGTLDQITHFLYELQNQGLRYDVSEITISPDAKREGILKGSMIVDCAYRKTAAKE